MLVFFGEVHYTADHFKPSGRSEILLVGTFENPDLL